MKFENGLVRTSRSIIKAIDKRYEKYSFVENAIIAQIIFESGWGKSDLAKKLNNFGGKKFRYEIQEYGDRVEYVDRYGDRDFYFACKSPEHYAELYFAFVGRTRYKSVRLDCEENYIKDLAKCGYVEKIEKDNGDLAEKHEVPEIYWKRISSIMNSKLFEQFIDVVLDEPPGWLNTDWKSEI